MRKRMISVWTKRIFTLALSLAVIAPASISASAEDGVEVPAPLMELDFESGFKGEVEDGFKVVDPEKVLNYKCTETPVGTNGTIYDYDFTTPLYEGTGSSADYKKTTTANTPATEYDELMGHVIWMHDDFTVSEFIKTEPAAYTNEETGELLTEINTVLDTAYPPYTPEYDADGKETEASLKAKEKATLQKEYTYYPEAQMNNPFATVDSSATDAVTVNYWINLEAEDENAAKSENTVVFSAKKTTVTPVEQDGKTTYISTNGLLQISADGSVIFSEDCSNTEAILSAKGSDTVLTEICKPAEWHMVTLEIRNDGIKTYYDGELSEVAGTVNSDSLLNWLVSADNVFIGGCNADITNALGFDANVTPFYLDDLSYYGQALSAEQIKELYNEGLDKLGGLKELPEATVITFDSEDDFSTEIRSNTPRSDKVDVPVLASDIRMGKVVKTFASKVAETSAAKIANPFAGKDITGATVSYWMKAEAKTEEGTYTGTVGVSFVDTAKEITHAKMQESSKGQSASSIIYGTTSGFAKFEEGSAHTTIPTTLKNSFTFATDTEVSNKMMADNDSEWHLYTMVLTNKGIKYYVDGQLLENTSIDRGPRFFDGYYQRIQDALDDNQLYGGSGNSGATALLTMLTYEDTSMYLAYANADKSTSTYQVCADAYFGEIECYDVALTDAQVAEVYANQVEKYPEVTVTKGDVDNDGNVTAADALKALKHAAKLEMLEGDETIAAEVSGDGTIDSADALLMLKLAAGLITEL